MTRALRALVEELEHDGSLYEPDQLSLRVEALDRLEAYLHEAQPTEEVIRHRARALSARLEAANVELYQTIRREIQRGAGRDALLPWVPKSGLVQREGYDFLDELIIGVFEFPESGIEPVRLAAEMVFYQPTPARHIFDLIDRTALTERDVLVDLGSGLGHVPLLASICTPAFSIGIELESAYIDCARQSAQGLNLNNVTFLQRDARTADFSAGTVFYLYTPFTGTILRAVLDSLEREASRREIRICTFGPCTPVVGKEPWLEASEPLYTDRIAVFCSGVN
jgi:hypothetical protein